jgi:hypothetical protein
LITYLPNFDSWGPVPGIRGPECITPRSGRQDERDDARVLPLVSTGPRGGILARSWLAFSTVTTRLLAAVLDKPQFPPMIFGEEEDFEVVSPPEAVAGGGP